MVFKTTGLSSRFQRSNRFWKICIGSWVIGQNVTKLEGLVWRVRFWHVLTNISGSNAYISKPIASLKPWAQAGRFEYHEPYKQENFFSTGKGVLSNFQRICGWSKTLRNQKILFSPYLLFPRATFPSWPKRSNEKSIFQPPLICMESGNTDAIAWTYMHV